MKKLMAVLLALTIVVGSASAVEFTVGGKGLASINFVDEPYDDGEYSAESFLGVGAGASAYCEIDFVKSGIFKFGIRPEAAFFTPIEKTYDSSLACNFEIKLPVWFTLSPTETFDVSAGIGWGIAMMGPTFDIQAAFKAGPGQIVVNPSFTFDVFGGFDSVQWLCLIGIGYQYTF